MGSEDHILFGIEDGVGVVTLNRPDRLNAINWDLARDLVKLFEDLRTKDEVTEAASVRLLARLPEPVRAVARRAPSR